MLASFNRYTFQPHHFVLAHDIVLDNFEQNVEQNDDNIFDCNKENDAQFTWDFPVNSSNLFHSSNTSLESLNLKNAVRSKLGGRKIPLQEQIKKHKAEKMEMMCSLRIEDFAKIGTDCVRLNLDSIFSRKNSKKQNSSKPLGYRTQFSHDELDQTSDHSIQFDNKHDKAQNGTSHDIVTRRVSRKLPEIPKTQNHQTAYKLSQDPVPASSLIRTPSLAEELKAALMAESTAHIDSGDDDDGAAAADDDDEETLQKSLPEGFHLNLPLHGDEDSNFTLDLTDLGSPEQIDPVNKYENYFNEFARSEKRACRKSCCLSDAIPNGEKDLQDADTMPVTASALAAAASGQKVMTTWLRTDAECMADDSMQGDFKPQLNTADVKFPGDVLRATGYLNVEGDVGTSTDNNAHDDDEDDDAEGHLIKRTTALQQEKSSLGKDNSQLTKALNPANPKRSLLPCGTGCTASIDFDLDEMDATHRGCHKFNPRHPGELAVEIGDYIYVQVEDDDLWCEGINLRTKQRGIFPSAYAMDLSLFDDDSRGSKFFVKFLGSIEVGFHKGNDVLCQAINKLVAARRKTIESNPPPLCCLEITEHGVKMTDRSKRKPKVASMSSHFRGKTISVNEKVLSENDHLFLLKNISFCGYHPKDDKYLGFITKHPLEMRFACHVFQSDKSTKVVAEAIGDAFRKFYQEYLAFVYPTEDIYLE